MGKNEMIETLKSLENNLKNYKIELEKNKDSIFYIGLVKNTEDYINDLKIEIGKLSIQDNQYSLNISEFTIGQIVIDIDKSDCEISDMTSSSIEVSIKRKTKDGINCRQWFNMRDFNSRFKKK